MHSPALKKNHFLIQKKYFSRYVLSLRFAPAFAQVAELVDALVSNTSGATRTGSTPVLGTTPNGLQIS
jgi:hypothetical protein